MSHANHQANAFFPAHRLYLGRSLLIRIFPPSERTTSSVSFIFIFKIGEMLFQCVAMSNTLTAGCLWMASVHSMHTHHQNMAMHGRTFFLLAVTCREDGSPNSCIESIRVQKSEYRIPQQSNLNSVYISTSTCCLYSLSTHPRTWVSSDRWHGDMAVKPTVSMQLHNIIKQ